MEHATIRLSETRPPRRYIRGRLDQDHVTELMEALDANGKKWLFPRVKVFRVTPADEKVLLNGKAGKALFELAGGYHRCTAAFTLGLEEVPAEIHPVSNDADALALQLLDQGPTNALRFSRKERNAAILAFLHEFKWPLGKVSELLGMSKASISRIAAGKQATGETGARKGKKKGKKGKKAQKEVKAGKITPADFFGALTHVVEAFNTHTKEFLHHTSIKIPNPNLLAAVANMARQLVEARMEYDKVSNAKPAGNGGK